MEIGIDSFAIASQAGKAVTPEGSAEHLDHLLKEIVLADQLGFDVFGVGEHHRPEFLDSAPPVILAAAAALTKKIRLTSAVTVLSAADPVRVFQEFATLDLLSKGRAEMVVGRGSFTEAFALFGYKLEDYEGLYDERLDLLLRIRDKAQVHWSGKFRPALTGQGVYPRPLQNPFPIWRGVGGSPESFLRAGQMGLPLMIAIIGGETRRFRPLVDLYYEAGHRAGHPRESLKVGVHAIGYVAKTTEKAVEDFYPAYAQVMNGFGKERGFPNFGRAQFDAYRGKEGSLLAGNPEEVVEKVLRQSRELGGLSRLTFQLSLAETGLPHEKIMESIELIGKEVLPALRAEGSVKP
jgi:probable LLM family oxidoreductase